MSKLFARFLPGLLAFIYLPAVLSSPGTEWLETQFNVDGSFQSSSDIATPFQATSEVLRTFNLIDDPISVDTNASLQFVSNSAFDNTEQLARKIIANTEAGNAAATLIALLLQHQNADGGFGDLTGYDSNPLDTALALEALAAADQRNHPAAAPAIGFLLALQNIDGSWALGGNEPSIYVTAIVLKTIWEYRRIFNVAGNLNQARDFLLSQRDATGLWGDVFESALSLIGIVPTLIDRSSVETSLHALQLLQQHNGSFEDDVYQTALALRALRLAELPSPDEILVTGRVLDGDTNLPLTGVVALLEGSTTYEQSTSSNGKFQFTNIQSGRYQLTLTLDNYGPILSTIDFQMGRQVDFGNLHMLPAINNPTGSNIIGTVTNATDGTPLPGVTITVAGFAQSAITTGSGQYQINGITSGTVDIQATLAGYVTEIIATNLVAGQTFIFSPSLTSLAESEVIVQGTVTDQESGQPLSDALISVQVTGNTATTTTNPAGQYEIAGLQPSDLALSVSLAGYQSASAMVVAPANAHINFSPALVLEGATPEPVANSGVMGIVVDRISGQPLPGVNVGLVLRSDSQGTMTDANGAFSFSNLYSGTAELTFSLPTYQSIMTSIELPENVILNFGQIKLLPEDVHETAGVRGVVVDSRTNEALAGVAINGQFESGNISSVTNQNGEFEFFNLLYPTGELVFTLDGYNTVNFGLQLFSGEILSLGQIRLRQEEIVELLPDLAISSVNSNGVTSDPQTLEISGEVNVDLVNQGNAEVNQPVNILAFYDANDDGLFESGIDHELGHVTRIENIAVDQSLSVVIPVSGNLPFRDAPMHVWLDSEQLLVESNETNNVSVTSGECRSDCCSSGSQSNITFKPVVKWYWSRAESMEVAYNQVMGAPVVAQLNDDNGDGVIDINDIPDVIFVTFRGNGYSNQGVMRAVSGADGSNVWASLNEVPWSWPDHTPAVGDIDGDGLVEIVTGGPSGIYVYENDGLLKWQRSASKYAPQPSLADLEGDGRVEIIYDGAIFDADGNMLWEGKRDATSVAVDLDLDGTLEVIASGAAYESNGDLRWDSGLVTPLNKTFTAIGNFDKDKFPEIVTKVDMNNFVILEHTGELKVGPIAIPGTGGGGITVADVDGDGESEIGIAGGTSYAVFEADGSVKWTSPTQDVSSRQTGSSVFDFNGDGRAEILYADELFFRAYDGESGETLFEIPNTSGTLYEYPLVVDIDNDNHAEIVVVANNYWYHSWEGENGVRVFENENDDWVATRSIWNQHSYHINNINEDGTIPSHEEPSWLSHNTYRLNAFPDQNVLALPDLTVSQLKVIDNNTGQPLNLSTRIGNGGGLRNPGGIKVNFYSGDTLLGSKELPIVNPGEYLDLSLDNVNGINAGEIISVMVDANNDLEECREDNNGMSIVAAGLLGEIELSINANVYSPNSDVQLNNLISNPGALTADYSLETRIEDTAGNQVSAFAAESVLALNGGGSTTVSQVWNTGLTVAGQYRAVALLKDSHGNDLDQDSVNFAILETINGQAIAELRTTTDRQQYHTTDTIQIMDLVRNTSVSTLIDHADLSLTVAAPDSTPVFAETLGVGSLAPGNLRELQTPLLLNAAAQGLYQVSAELRDGNGTLLANDQAGFEVLENPLLSLSGSVQAQLPELYVGQTQICHYTVSNNGSLDLPAQAIWQVLVNVTDETEIETIPLTQDINAGQSTGFIQSVTTTGLVPGDYACVLQATINGDRVSLANAIFKLSIPPINLNVDFSLGDRGRLLVLLDEDKRHCYGEDYHKDHLEREHGWKYDNDKYHDKKDDQHRDHDDDKYGYKHGLDKHGDHGRCHDDEKNRQGNREYPGLSEQRAWLEQTLDEAGWSYTIVTDKYAFSRELRSGGYTVYALLSASVKLDNTTLEELREAVFRGEGLLLAGHHDERNSKINPALGVKLVGKTWVTGIEVLETDFHSAANADFVGAQQVLNARLEGAEVLANFSDGKSGNQCDPHCSQYHGKPGDRCSQCGNKYNEHQHHSCQPDPEVAITGNAYGEGQAIYMGFDLLREAAANDPVNPDNLFTGLLLDSLSYIHPEMIEAVMGRVLPLKLTIENLGIATVGQALISLPEGSEVMDYGAATAFEENTPAWLFDLQTGETDAVTIQVLPPYADELPLQFTALIQTGQAPDFIDYETVSLSVSPVTAADIDTILANIDALNNADKAIRQAKQRLQKAQYNLDRQHYEQALQELIQATDKLMVSHHAEATVIRLQIDSVIKAVARQIGNDNMGQHKGGRRHD